MVPVVISAGSAVVRSIAARTILTRIGQAAALQRVAIVETVASKASKAVVSKVTELTIKTKALKAATQLAAFVAIESAVNWLLGSGDEPSADPAAQTTTTTNNPAPYTESALTAPVVNDLYEMCAVWSALEILLADLPVLHSVHTVNTLLSIMASCGSFNSAQMSAMRIYINYRIRFGNRKTEETRTFINRYWATSAQTAAFPLGNTPAVAFLGGLASAFGISALACMTIIITEYAPGLTPSEIVSAVSSLHKYLRDDPTYDDAIEAILTKPCELGDFLNTAMICVQCENAVTLSEGWGIRPRIGSILQQAYQATLG